MAKINNDVIFVTINKTVYFLTVWVTLIIEWLYFRLFYKLLQAFNYEKNLIVSHWLKF